MESITITQMRHKLNTLLTLSIPSTEIEHNIECIKLPDETAKFILQCEDGTLYNPNIEHNYTLRIGNDENQNEPMDECCDTQSNVSAEEDMIEELPILTKEQIDDIIGIPKETENIQSKKITLKRRKLLRKFKFTSVRNSYRLVESRMQQNKAMKKVLMQLDKLHQENERLKKSNAKLFRENKCLLREVRVMQTNIISGKYRGGHCDKSFQEICNLNGSFS